MTLEQEAQALGNNPCLLRKRLNEARSVLATEFADLFTLPEFSLEDKCLKADGYRLQWRVRRWPNLPISYENQQTSVEHVSLHKEK